MDGESWKVITVSILQLIATPQNFHGQSVQVLGYCRLELERTAIYLYKEDHLYGLSNTLWLEMPVKDITPQRQAIRYCMVRGKFNSTNRGHGGLYGGAIEEIVIRFEAS